MNSKFMSRTAVILNEQAIRGAGVAIQILSARANRAGLVVVYRTVC
jgi:hypothetical protein